MKADRVANKRSLLRRAKEAYSKKGAAGLGTKAFRYVYAKLVRKRREGVSFQEAKSYATDIRWQHIKNNIRESDNSLLDIGCDSGAFTSLSADFGLFSIGIDRYSDDLFSRAEQVARSRSEGRSNMGIIKMDLGPTNISYLPTFDVVLLLGVHHHWHCQYGEQNARNMIASLKGSKRVFFSSSSRKRRYEEILKYFHDDKDVVNLIPDLGDTKTSVVRYYTNLLESELGKEYNVRLICSTKYNRETRHMLLAEKTHDNES